MTQKAGPHTAAHAGSAGAASPVGRDGTAADGLASFANLGADQALFDAAFERALSRGADWAELYFEHRVSHSLGLEDASVNRATVAVSLGVGVRVVRGDQQGYAYTEDLSRERVVEAAGTAAMIADGPARGRPQAFEVHAPATRYPARLPWEGIGVEQKMPVLTRLNELAFALDPRISKVRVGFQDSTGCVLIVDSSGRISLDRQPMASVSVSCTGEHRGRRESSGYNMARREGFEFLTEERIEGLSRRAVERTLFLFEAEPAPAGEFPIVLAAGSSGILLHEAIGHGMEADFNRKGTSVYSDRVNTRIAPRGVTIVDDGTQPGARGSINVDDEGVEGQQTVLVEDGILRTYMHDRISAQHYGLAPTGNGRRESFRHVPLPRMRNTYMLSGTHARDEIIGSVERGIFAESFTNGQVNIGAGDFTFYIKTGYLIEGGRLTRPIKDTNIIGNGPECLERVEMIGNDFAFDDGGWTCGKDGQQVPVSLGMPTLKVGAITVGGVNRG